MGKRTIVEIHKITQQHGSIVVVIPMLVRSVLKLDPGDHLVFEVESDTNKVTMSKFEVKGSNDVSSS